MKYFSNELTIAIEAAKIGAKQALSFFNKNIEHETKADNSPVTIADKTTEQAIREFISSKQPNANFVGEEEGGDRLQKTFWIIDPIDGTRSFIRDIDSWCVLIAYYQNNEITHGVSYFPLYDLLITGEKGKGAYANNQKLQVSNVQILSQAYGAYSDLAVFDLQMLGEIRKSVASFRNPESTYAYYLLASGKIDFVIDGGAKLWDFAPFVPIIQEAGGKITNQNNKPLKIADIGFLASNGMLHEDVFSIVNKYK